MDIVNTIKEVLLERHVLAEKPDPTLKPGFFKPIPGTSKFKAMNRRGSVKVLDNSAKAREFALGESKTFQDAFETGLDKFGIESLHELDESKIPEFFDFVEEFYKKED